MAEIRLTPSSIGEDVELQTRVDKGSKEPDAAERCYPRVLAEPLKTGLRMLSRLIECTLYAGLRVVVAPTPSSKLPLILLLIICRKCSLSFWRKKEKSRNKFALSACSTNEYISEGRHWTRPKTEQPEDVNTVTSPKVEKKETERTNPTTDNKDVRKPQQSTEKNALKTTKRGPPEALENNAGPKPVQQKAATKQEVFGLIKKLEARNPELAARYRATLIESGGKQENYKSSTKSKSCSKK